MTNTKNLLATLGLASVILSAGCTNVRTIGTVNGVNLTRVTTRGLFSPATTTILASDPCNPGSLEVLTSAHGPGFVPAVANAGGIAGAAALLRPSKTTVENNAAGGNGNVGNGNVGNGGFIPPGHINNPGHGNHHSHRNNPHANRP